MADTFTLDTSGAVHLVWGVRIGRTAYAGDIRFRDLPAFVQGYIQAAFASWRVPMIARAFADDAPLLTADGERPGGPPVFDPAATPPIRALGFRDLAPETLAAMLKDCEAMYARRDWWGDDGELSAGQTDAEAGAEFWHDRQAERWPESFPPVELYIDDAGQVRQREMGAAGDFEADPDRYDAEAALVKSNDPLRDA